MQGREQHPYEATDQSQHHVGQQQVAESHRLNQGDQNRKCRADKGDRDSGHPAHKEGQQHGNRHQRNMPAYQVAADNLDGTTIFEDALENKDRRHHVKHTEELGVQNDGSQPGSRKTIIVPNPIANLVPSLKSFHFIIYFFF